MIIGPLSYGEHYKITSLPVRPSFRHFLRNYPLVFSDAWHNCSQLEYLKTDKALFPKKIHFCPNLGKKEPKWPQNKIFCIFWKTLTLLFFGNDLKWKLILLLIFCGQSHIWKISEYTSCGPKFCQQIKLQDSLKDNISRKNWMLKFIFDMHINIEVFYKLMLSSWVCPSSHVQSTQSKFVYLRNISTKAWWMNIFFCLQINTKVSKSW